MAKIKNGGLDQYGAEPFKAANWNCWHWSG